MTTGNILSKILNFSVFIFIGGLLQNLYLLIDSIIIGRYLGEDALATIGIVNPINFIIIGFLIGLAYGFGLIMAKFFGAKNFESFKHYFFHSIVLSFFIGISFTIVLSLINNQLLKIVNTPSHLFSDTHSFSFTLYLGITATLLYNLFSATLRSIGDSITPVIFLAISVFINAVLVFIFVAILNLGLVGSALGTIISQTIAALLCFFYILKKYPEISFKKEDCSLRKGYFSPLLKQGVPMGLQFSFTGIGLIVVQNFLNDFGTNYIAGYSVASRVQSIIIYCFIALATATSTFVSQNVGARKFKRIDEAMKLVTLTSIAMALVVTLIIWLFAPKLVYLFTSVPNQELIDATSTYFHYVMWAYIPLALLILYRNALQGYGFSLTAMSAGVVELVLRVVVILIFTGRLGYLAVCLSDSITWLFTAIFLVVIYFVLIKVKKEKHTL